jgi:hypothetical protein
LIVFVIRSPFDDNRSEYCHNISVFATSSCGLLKNPDDFVFTLAASPDPLDEAGGRREEEGDGGGEDATAVAGRGLYDGHVLRRGRRQRHVHRRA